MTTETAQHEHDLRARLNEVEATIADFDQQLAQIAYLAEAKGNADAREKQSELLTARRHAQDHVEQLRLALAGAERAVAAEREAADAEQQAAALEQADAARRDLHGAALEVDDALAALEAAFTKFEQLRRANDEARRAAGLRTPRRYGLSMLSNAIWRFAPTIASAFRVGRMVRGGARSMAHQVVPPGDSDDAAA